MEAVAEKAALERGKRLSKRGAAVPGNARAGQSRGGIIGRHCKAV